VPASGSRPGAADRAGAVEDGPKTPADQDAAELGR